MILITLQHKLFKQLIQQYKIIQMKYHDSDVIFNIVAINKIKNETANRRVMNK